MRIKNVIELAKTKFLIFKELHYTDKKGTERIWNSVSRVNDTKAVMIVAVREGTLEEGRQLVVTKEFRVPIDDYEWGMPAGLIDNGELIEQAAARELQEETGLSVNKIFAVSPFTYNSAGMTDEAISMAFVEVTGKTNQKGNEESEDIQTFLMNPDQVAELLSHKDYKFGAKAWIIMDRFARTGHII